MRKSLSFIVCFQAIHAGLRESLVEHAVSALSDYVQHRVSYSLSHIKSEQSELIISEIGAIEFECNPFSISWIERN